MSFEQDGADTIVRAGAGAAWDEVVAGAVQRGLAGLECLSGIPGSVGGTPIQNVGAYGQEVADTIVEVAAFDHEQGSAVSLSPGECQFAYRTSRFKQADAGRFAVSQVSFRLRPGSPTTTYPDVVKHLREKGVTQPTIADVRDAVLAIRRGKGMVIDASDVDTRSVGSFFTNPVVEAATWERLKAEAGGHTVPGYVLASGDVKVPAAWLIEQAGFGRGFEDGAAGLSSKHPLAIINRGGATARDVLGLAARIKRQVADRFGIALRAEPVFVGFANDPGAAYLSTGTL
jgi:UDP-N-acetylmuramate dehydrogenase